MPKVICYDNRDGKPVHKHLIECMVMTDVGIVIGNSNFDFPETIKDLNVTEERINNTINVKIKLEDYQSVVYLTYQIDRYEYTNMTYADVMNTIPFSIERFFKK